MIKATSFLDHYELYNSAYLLTEKFEKELEGKKCRFCQKAHPDTTFNSVPHIIPELFGRNKTSSNFECDACNARFQKCESDTSTMVQHWLSLMNTKTKKGVPIFNSIKKNSDKPTVLRTDGEVRRINFDTNLDDFAFDDVNRTLTITFRTRKFCPYSVYKVFLKMGLSLLKEDDLGENAHFLDFLNADSPIENGMQVWTLWRYILKTKYHAKPMLLLYRAKSVLGEGYEIPEFVVIMSFANVVYQMFLPVSERNIAVHQKERTLRLELFPSFAWENLARLDKIEFRHFDLSQTKKVTVSDTVVLHYGREESDFGE